MLFTNNRIGLKALFDIAHNNTIFGFSREIYRPEMLIAVVSIISLWIINTIREQTEVGEVLSKKRAYIPWTLYCLMACSILFFGMFTREQFIYFRF